MLVGRRERSSWQWVREPAPSALDTTRGRRFRSPAVLEAKLWAMRGRPAKGDGGAPFRGMRGLLAPRRAKILRAGGRALGGPRRGARLAMGSSGNRVTHRPPIFPAGLAVGLPSRAARLAVARAIGLRPLAGARFGSKLGAPPPCALHAG